MVFSQIGGRRPVSSLRFRPILSLPDMSRLAYPGPFVEIRRAHLSSTERRGERHPSTSILLTPCLGFIRPGRRPARHRSSSDALQVPARAPARRRLDGTAHVLLRAAGPLTWSRRRRHHHRGLRARLTSRMPRGTGSPVRAVRLLVVLAGHVWPPLLLAEQNTEDDLTPTPVTRWKRRLPCALGCTRHPEAADTRPWPAMNAGDRSSRTRLHRLAPRFLQRTPRVVGPGRRSLWWRSRRPGLARWDAAAPNAALCGSPRRVLAVVATRSEMGPGRLPGIACPVRQELDADRAGPAREPPRRRRHLVLLADTAGTGGVEIQAKSRMNSTKAPGPAHFCRSGRRAVKRVTAELAAHERRSSRLNPRPAATGPLVRRHQPHRRTRGLQKR